MNAIDDLRQLSELLGKAEAAGITVADVSDNPFTVQVRMRVTHTGVSLRAKDIDLRNVVTAFRAEFGAMIVQRLEARIRDLLPAAKREYDEARELLAKANMREAVLRTQGADSAQERPAL